MVLMTNEAHSPLVTNEIKISEKYVKTYKTERNVRVAVEDLFARIEITMRRLGDQSSIRYTIIQTESGRYTAILFPSQGAIQHTINCGFQIIG